MFDGMLASHFSCFPNYNILRLVNCNCFYVVFDCLILRLGSEVTQQKQLKDDAEAVMQQMMTYVHYTAVSIYRFTFVNIYSLFSLVAVLCH